MKRSEINREIKFALKVFEENKFYLPKIAYFNKQDWLAHKDEQRLAIENGMGWDVTDYGHGRYDEFGLCVFTLRNGNMKSGKSHVPYSEKVLVMKPGQRLPLHMHGTKIEDIINRGGGTLKIQLYNAIDDQTIDQENDVSVFCDAVEKRVKAGGIVEIKPGESITLKPGHFHKFWAEADHALIVGEVSTVNDDSIDNRHVEDIQRFVEVEEDEEPVALLKNEYKKILG
jgi:D-lyxose ketol-isomerase